MKYFYNSYPNCYEELLSYYPRFYVNIYEMRAILKALGKMADDLKKNVERVINNCFIDDADNYMLSEIETFLKINGDLSRTVDERRRLIKSMLAGFGKLSASKLSEMIKQYTGTDSKILLSPESNVLSILLLKGAKSIHLSDVKKLLSIRLPAHISYTLTLQTNSHNELKGYDYNALAKLTQDEIKEVGTSEAN